MKRGFLRRGVFLWAVCVLWCAVSALLPPLHAAPENQPGKTESEATSEKTAEAERDALVESGKGLTADAEERIGRFAAHVRTLVSRLAQAKATGWGGLVCMVLFGGGCLFFGWSFLKRAFLPFCAVTGAATGGFIVLCLVLSLASGDTSGLVRIAALAAGAGAGLAASMFLTRKAPPLGRWLVVAAPFLVLSIAAFPVNTVLALVLVALGMVVGLIATFRMRAVAICSTSLFGAAALVAAFGTFVELTKVSFLVNALDWMTDKPWMLTMATLVVFLVGVNFQSISGPAEGEVEKPQKRTIRPPR